MKHFKVCVVIFLFIVAQPAHLYSMLLGRQKPFVRFRLSNPLFTHRLGSSWARVRSRKNFNHSDYYVLGGLVGSLAGLSGANYYLHHRTAIVDEYNRDKKKNDKN